MKDRIDIRRALKNGLWATLSDPKFLVFGSLIAVPKLILQFVALGGDGFLGRGGSFLRAENDSLQTLVFLFFFLGIAIIFGSAGMLGISNLMNRREIGLKTTFSFLKKCMSMRLRDIVTLEIFLGAFVLLLGVILAMPSNAAASRGLEGLSQVLAYSALGLLFFIALLVFFLRQYAALYLSLSDVSLRSALDSSSMLLRLHAWKTVILSASLFFLEITLLLVLSSGFTFFQGAFGKILSAQALPFGFGAEWIILFGVISGIEAWKWASWTSFFRMIALPKDPKPVLQKTETVLQQESVVGMDKA